MQSPVRNLFAVSALAIFLTICYFLATPLFHSGHVDNTAAAYRPAFRAPKPNVWSELDDNEANDLYKFLFEPSNQLNLTRHPTGAGGENYIKLIEALEPNKTDVLSYLDGSKDAPGRWARVSIAQDNSSQAMIVNYMVGPLPPRHGITEILPLTFCYNSGRNWVSNPIPNYLALVERLTELAESVSDITLDLLGAGFNATDPMDPDSLEVFARVARSEKGGMVYWGQFYRKGLKTGAMSILPQGIYFKVNTMSSDRSEWHISQWYYNNKLYPNLTSFRTAWKSPDFKRAAPNFDGEWTSTEDFDSTPNGRSLPPPLPIQPMGPRYSLSAKDQYVSYLGWTFYYSTSSATGVSLFDVRFYGSRVMYSLALQEALAHYAGADPFQGGLEFLDTTFFGMGAATFSLVPGYDCPAYADFMNLTFHHNGKLTENRNAICLFEFTSDAPLSRHKSDDAVTVSRNTHLIMRTVATVGNYDYTFDYIFYLDGTIEVKMRASGFIWAAFFPDSDEELDHTEYSYHIHDSVMSSMHDHEIAFRADLDVAGTANTLYRISVEPTTKTYPWDPPDQPGPRKTMHLAHHKVHNETGLNWPRNSGEMFVVMNTDAAPNTWGERRGYRIAPGTGMGTPSHLTIENSTALGKSAAWAYADLWVLHQHDHEPRAASELNSWDPWDPLVDFEAMVDGESVVQEDLIVLFNLGSHHVPTTSDIPNTLEHTSASSVMFIPHNFFDRDVSRASVQGVRIEERHGENTVRYFGTPYEDGVQVAKKDLEPEQSVYNSGDGPQWVWWGTMMGLGRAMGYHGDATVDELV